MVPLVGNPAPLGLAAFGVTTFVLSCYNASMTVPADAPPMIVLGFALVYGGIVQLLAGMWEFKTGNTFEATAFSSYGVFWLSYSCILIPGLNKIWSYVDKNGIDNPKALDHAIGIFLLAWSIMFLCTLRQNIASILLFGKLDVTFFLAISSFEYGRPISKTSKQAAGFTGIVTAFVALYMALASLASEEHAYFTLPIGVIDDIEKRLYDV